MKERGGEEVILMQGRNQVLNMRGWEKEVLNKKGRKMIVGVEQRSEKGKEVRKISLLERGIVLGYLGEVVEGPRKGRAC